MNVPKIIIATGAALALVAAGTAAGASIARISVNSGNPVNDGVINGCYTLKATNGSHHLALQTWGTKCPTGTTKIQWNGQTTVPQRLMPQCPLRPERASLARTHVPCVRAAPVILMAGPTSRSRNCALCGRAQQIPGQHGGR